MNTVNTQRINYKQFMSGAPHLLNTNLPESKMDPESNKYSIMAGTFVPINKIQQKVKQFPNENCSHS